MTQPSSTPSPPQSSVAQQFRELQDQVAGLDQRLKQVEQRLRLGAPSRPPSTAATPAAAHPPVSAPAPSAPLTSTMLTGPSVPPVAKPPLSASTDSPSTTSTPGVGGASPASILAGADTSRSPAWQHSTLQDIAARSSEVSVGAPPSQVAGSVAPPIPPITPPASNQPALVDWEGLIGGRWALWLGSLCEFLAIASFLAIAWSKLPPAPPGVRVALGLLVGTGFLGGGAVSRNRAQRWFSEGLSGAGLGVLYLSIWAGAQHFGILPFGVAFCCMAAITALGVALAVGYDALSLSVLATLGGFLTPLLLSGGHGVGSSPTGLLTYITVLDAGIVVVSIFKRWRGLTWLSFVATILVLGSWASTHYSSVWRSEVFAFVTLDFLMFLGASCFYSLWHDEPTAPEDLLLFFADTFAYAVAGYALLNGAMGAVPGAFALALTLLFAFIGVATRMLAPTNAMLRQSASWLSLFFLTVAVPMQLRQDWLSVGWSAEAATLLMVSRRLRAPLLRQAGQIVWLLSLPPLLLVLVTTPWHLPILFNERSLSLLVSVGVAWLAALYHPQSDKDHIPSAATLSRIWDDMAPAYAAYAVLSGAWLLSSEIYEVVRLYHWPSAGTWHAGALLVIAMASSAYALGVYVLGRRCHNMMLRLSALAVAMLSGLLPGWAGLAFSMAGWTPFWNLRWAAFLVVAAVLGGLARLVARERDTGLDPEESEALSVVCPAVSLFVLAGMTTELYFGFAHRSGDACSALSFACDWRATAGFATALLWSLFAMGLTRLGELWGEPKLRALAIWIGLAGIGLLIFDALASSSLSWTPFFNLRALAFIGAAGFISDMAQQSRRANTAVNTLPLRGVSAGELSVRAGSLLLWGVTQEIFETCRHFRPALGTDWLTVALFVEVILWGMCAIGLLAVGIERRERLMRLLAGGLGSVAVGALLIVSIGSARLGWTPVLNIRLLAFLVTVIALSGATLLLRRRRNLLDADEQTLIVPLGLLAALVILWGLTLETSAACYFWRYAIGAQWERWAQMTISILWSLYGALLLIGGVSIGGRSRRAQPVRLAGLGLLGLTALKVFLYDLSFLGGTLRSLPLAGLGVSLIFISWLYSRFGAGGAKNSPAPK